MCRHACRIQVAIGEAGVEYETSATTADLALDPNAVAVTASELRHVLALISDDDIRALPEAVAARPKLEARLSLLVLAEARALEAGGDRAGAVLKYKEAAKSGSRESRAALRRSTWPPSQMLARVICHPLSRHLVKAKQKVPTELASTSQAGLSQSLLDQIHPDLHGFTPSALAIMTDLLSYVLHNVLVPCIKQCMRDSDACCHTHVYSALRIRLDGELSENSIAQVHSYGLYNYGLYSHGLYNYGLYSILFRRAPRQSRNGLPIRQRLPIGCLQTTHMQRSSSARAQPIGLIQMDHGLPQQLRGSYSQ